METNKANNIHMPASMSEPVRKRLASIYREMTSGMPDGDKPLLFIYDDIGDVAAGKDRILKHIMRDSGRKGYFDAIKSGQEDQAKRLGVTLTEKEKHRAAVNAMLVSMINATGGAGAAMPSLNMAILPSGAKDSVIPLSAHELGHLNSPTLGRVADALPGAPGGLLAGSVLASLLKRPALSKKLGIAALITAPLALAPIISEWYASRLAKKHLPKNKEKKVLSKALGTYIVGNGINAVMNAIGAGLAGFGGNAGGSP